MTKEMKELIKAVWIDQIKTAMYAANNAVKFNSEDGGTCNFDMCLIKKEKIFSIAETQAIFAECGLQTRVMKGCDKGYIGIPHFVGQGNKNTRWVKAFKKSLERQGFVTSIFYQID